MKISSRNLQQRPSSVHSTRTSLSRSQDSEGGKGGVKLSIQLDDHQTIEIMSSSETQLPSSNNGTTTSAAAAAAAAASTLTDEELAIKAQEELNMEGEMEEVRMHSYAVPPLHTMIYKNETFERGVVFAHSMTGMETSSYQKL